MNKSELVDLLTTYGDRPYQPARHLKPVGEEAFWEAIALYSYRRWRGHETSAWLTKFLMDKYGSTNIALTFDEDGEVDGILVRKSS